MDQRKRITALVPMKGQSQRVKGKNLRQFGDRALCEHILGTLEQCLAIAAIIVNTDSEEIARLSSTFSKVSIHERPQSLHGHDVPMNAIIAWDLEHDQTGAEHFLQTHATNPLLTSATLERSLEKYFEDLDRNDSLFTVTELKSRFYLPGGQPINHDPAVLLKTQDLPPIFEENSCIYIFSRESFRNAGQRRIGASPQMYPIDKTEAMDIDTEEEFMIAEAVWQKLQKDRNAGD